MNDNIIKIVDMPMGTGKTNGLIEYMNSHPDKKFIFITPFLSEVERIKESCKELDFREPSDTFTKMGDFRKLISEHKNIASTHALFGLIDKSVISLLYSSGYTLVLDEVLEVVDKITIDKKDRQVLIDSKVIKIEEDGRVIVIDDEYKNKGMKFSREIGCMRNKKVYLVDNTLMICLFDSEVFSAFDEIIILTYLFKNSLMESYLTLNEMKYSFYKIEEKEIVPGKFDDISFREKAKNLINLYDGKLNRIGEERGSLTSTWYNSSKNKDEHKILKNNMYNYFKHVTKSTCAESMWSTFIGTNSKHKKFFSPKSFSTDSFIQCNARATNKYREKKNLEYCVNVYINPYIAKYFSRNGAKLDSDNFAISQLIQWIWRSRIRDGQPINLYLPSQRMRNLLIRWENGEEL